MMAPFNTVSAGRINCLIESSSSSYEGLSPNLAFSPNPDLGKGAEAKHQLPSPLFGGFAILNLFFLSSWEHSLPALPSCHSHPGQLKAALFWDWGGGGGARCCCPGARPTTWHQSQAVLRQYLPPTRCTSTERHFWST